MYNNNNNIALYPVKIFKLCVSGDPAAMKNLGDHDVFTLTRPLTQVPPRGKSTLLPLRLWGLAVMTIWEGEDDAGSASD